MKIAYHREKTKNRLGKEYTQIGRDIMVHGFSRNSSWLKFEVFKRTLHVTCYTLSGFRENKGKDKADLRSETTYSCIILSKTINPIQLSPDSVIKI